MFEHQLQSNVFEEQIFSGAKDSRETFLFFFRHGKGYGSGAQQFNAPGVRHAHPWLLAMNRDYTHRPQNSLVSVRYSRRLTFATVLPKNLLGCESASA